MPKTKITPLPWQTALSDQNRASFLRIIQNTDSAMFKSLQSATKDVGRIISGLSDNGIGALVRKSMYLQQSQAIRALSQSLWVDKIGPSIERGLTASTLSAVDGQRQMTEFLLRAAPSSMATLSGSLLSSAERSWMDVRSRVLNGINLSPSVYSNAALMSGKIDSLVNTGIALGQSAKEIADSVIGYVNPMTPGGARYAAMRLGRTELNNAFRSTTAQSYAKQPWIEGVQWNLSGSHPSDDECNGLAEADDYDLGPGVYPRDQIPFPPHPQCLCYDTAITPTPEQFVNNLLNGQYDEGFGGGVEQAVSDAVSEEASSLASIINSGRTGDYFSSQNWAEKFAIENSTELATNFSKMMSKWTNGNFKSIRKEIDAVLKGEKIASSQVDAFLQVLRASKDAPELFRGMSLGPKVAERVLADFAEGSFTDLPISSFTFDRAQATRFARGLTSTGKVSANNVEFILKLEKGSSSVKAEAFVGDKRLWKEREWVTGGRFEVVKVYRSGNRVTVTIRQVNNL